MTKYKTQYKFKRDKVERDPVSLADYLKENADRITAYMDETGQLENGGEYAVFRFYMKPKEAMKWGSK